MLGNRLIHDLEESPMRTPKTILMSVWLHVQKHGKQGGSSWPAFIEMQQNVHNQHLKLITEAVLRDTLTLTFVYFVSTRSLADYSCSDFITMLINSDWRSKDQKTDLFSKEHEMFLELKTHEQVFKLLTLEGQSHLWFGCSTIRLLDRHVLH